MNHEIIIAGFGGQGVLFAGRLLAYCAMLCNYELSWIPSYGPEMRGGTCNCHVIISDEPISSPVVTKPSVLLAMNLPSLLKYRKLVKKDGLIIFDDSKIFDTEKRDDVKNVNISATLIANKHKIAANIIMVSRLIKEISLCDFETFSLAIKNIVSYNQNEVLQKNLQAAYIGYNI